MNPLILLSDTLENSSMRSIVIIFISALSITLPAQENNWAIATDMGGVYDMAASVSGSQFGIEIQRHLKLGVYGVIAYGRSHLFDGYDSALTQDKVPRSISQLNIYSLDLKKILQVNDRNAIGICMKGNMIPKSGTVWNSILDEEGLYDLENLRGKYLRRYDLGLGHDIEFDHSLSEYLSLGLYAGYLTKLSSSNKLELLSSGVRTTAIISSRETITNNRNNTLSKN